MVKLLIVEDDPDLLEMLTLFLGTRGMRVISVNSGAQLFDTLDEEKPDIVLMDIYLGDSDGRNLCRQIKNAGEYPAVPVVLYSAGNISKSSIVDSLADDFLQKPFDLFSLINRIQENLKRSRN